MESILCIIGQRREKRQRDEHENGTGWNNGVPFKVIGHKWDEIMIWNVAYLCNTHTHTQTIPTSNLIPVHMLKRKIRLPPSSAARCSI